MTQGASAMAFLRDPRPSHVRKNLVPTARLELAQLSPLPPQDSVSTNFTTSELSCNPEKQLLIAGNRFKNKIITGLTSLFNAQKAIQAKNYFGTSEPGPDDATGTEGAAEPDRSEERRVGK